MNNYNKSTACGCQCSAVGYLIEDKKSKSKKTHNSEKKMHFELSPLIVWIALWIVNTYSEFQVNIFSNNRDMTKCQRFCTFFFFFSNYQFLKLTPMTNATPVAFNALILSGTNVWSDNTIINCHFLNFFHI